MHWIVYYRLQFDIIDYLTTIDAPLLLLACLRLGSVEGFVDRSFLSLWD